MIKEAIEKIVGLSAPNIRQAFGLDFTDKPMTAISPPMPSPLYTETLSSLVQYLKAGFDYDEEMATLFLHIENPTAVTILSDLNLVNKRCELVKAVHPSDLQTKIFGTYYDIEAFIIKMKTQFVETEASLNVIRLVGNIRDEKVAKVVDDGISQKITTSTGVASISDVVIPNPIVLKPFRTFFDVEQPASPFLLRMKQGQAGQMPSCALYEADGGMWHKEAMDNIEYYLKAALPGVIILA